MGAVSTNLPCRSINRDDEVLELLELWQFAASGAFIVRQLHHT